MTRYTVKVLREKFHKLHYRVNPEGAGHDGPEGCQVCKRAAESMVQDIDQVWT